MALRCCCKHIRPVKIWAAGAVDREFPDMDEGFHMELPMIYQSGITITWHCSDSRKQIQTVFPQNGVCVVSKMIPHPVGVLCTHLEAPRCHIRQKSFCWGIFDITGKTSSKARPRSARY
jgi:hypothetical protein